MSNSQASTTADGVTLDASEVGVSTVRNGPAGDRLDEVEAMAFLEARLKCDLLRAQIRAIDREQELKSFVTRRRAFRADFVFTITLVALLWSLFDLTRIQSGPLIALIAILGMTLRSATAAADRHS